MSKRLFRKAGFTLAETLLAMLILLIAATLMMQGVPMALRVYHKIMDAANAHALISTTMTELRDKISLASEIEKDGTTVVFVSDDGRTYELLNWNDETSGDQGLYLKDNSIAGENGNSRLLVSDSAAAKNLYARFESADYTDGIVTFNKLEVCRKKETNPIVSVAQYDVKIINVQN